MSLVQALLRSIAQGSVDAEAVDLVMKAPVAEVNDLALVVVTPPPVPRDLFEAHDPEFQEHPLRRQLRELPAPIQEAIRTAANRRIADATPKPSSSMPALREQLALQEKTKNALAGLCGSSAIDWASLEREVAETVAAAKVARMKSAFDPDSVEAFRQSFIGLNDSPDRIVTVELDKFGTLLNLRAEDEIGYRVVEAQLGLRSWPPPSVHLEMLRATHGRNANEVQLTEGAAEMIGRGNPKAVATFFLGAIRLARAAGFEALSLRPGGPSVARLYQRMGFETLLGGDMRLDLTDRSKVEAFLLGFYPSRWQQTLDGADVSNARATAGDWLTLPAGV